MRIINTNKKKKFSKILKVYRCDRHYLLWKFARMTRKTWFKKNLVRIWFFLAMICTNTSIHCLLNESVPSHFYLINEWENHSLDIISESKFHVTRIFEDLSWNFVYYLPYIPLICMRFLYVVLVRFWLWAIQISSALMTIIKRSSERSTQCFKIRQGNKTIIVIFFICCVEQSLFVNTLGYLSWCVCVCECNSISNHSRTNALFVI